ncbi:MAG TPA: TylF/MycF/NovP-related O-methyltransferase [Acidobacteriaceae bacterium]
MAVTKRIVDSIVAQPAFDPLVRPMLKVAAYASRSRYTGQDFQVLSYDQPYRAEGVRLIRQIRAEREMLLSLPEAYSIFAAVKQTAKVPGDIAEVGVYQGGSSKLICEAKGARQLHLFDTFAGLPPLRSIDRAKFTEGEYTCALDSVREYLHSYSGITFYKGLFPETAAPLSNNHRFSFVHIDVDLYESTLSCLEFFYPRMSPGAVIISHDYHTVRGVKAAFDEFLADRPEPLIEMTGDQCMVVRIG